MSSKKTILICTGILLIAVAVIFLIFSTEPTAKSEGSSKETAMLVSLTEAEYGSFVPVIKATGTVKAVEDVQISPLVGGQIVRRAANFVPGSFVKKDEVLLQIDPADYRNTLELRKGELMQIQTNMDVEMGRQQVAEQDLALVGMDSLSQNQRELVLRKPQLNAVKANLKAAKASVDQARLNLSRTTIKAPFDAHILNQNVTVGSQVAPGDNLGRLVGTDFYWITATVPVAKLQWLTFPKMSSGSEEKGSTVKIRNTTAWPEGVYREGYLNKEIGALDGQTRLARILVKVDDPLMYEKQEKDLPKLMIGAFVEVNIEGKQIEGVVRLNRDYLRPNQTVWVMEDKKLKISKVDITLSDSKYIYVSKGLEKDDQVVMTNLSTVAEGLALRRDTNDSTSVEKTGSTAQDGGL